VSEIVEMVKYKLRRIRDLATPRYMQWLLIQRFCSGATLTVQLDRDITIQYLPTGNVSRDLYLGQIEDDVVEFLKWYLRPGMVAMDIGANIGIYSLLIAKYVGASGSVHAFEPTPRTFEQLCANYELNGFTCVQLNQLAVADKSGTSTFYLYNQCGMNSMRRQDWVGKPLEQIVVETISLDEYVLAKNLQRVDLLKIDVEGAELTVFKGARSLLCSLNPPVVVCEFADKTTRNFGYQTASLRDYLESLGYQLFRWNSESGRLVPEPIRPNYEIYANLVCIK